MNGLAIIGQPIYKSSQREHRFHCSVNSDDRTHQKLQKHVIFWICAVLITRDVVDKVRLSLKKSVKYLT